MKTILTSLLVLLSLSWLFAQDCTVKIVFSANKSLPPSYTFKVDPQSEGAKYSWSFGDNTDSDQAIPTHSFKMSGSYLVKVKATRADGKICIGELKTIFDGGTASNTSTILSGKGKVINKAATNGCGLVINMENGNILIPIVWVPEFQLKDGQYLELAYEILKDRVTECPAGVAVKIHKIAEIIMPSVCKLPITFVKSTATPTSYSFKTSAQPEGSIYYWYFGDEGKSSLESPTYTYKKAGTYAVNLKVIDKAGNSCHGEIKAVFEGAEPTVLAARGKVKKLTASGCELAIVLDNGTTLIAAKMATYFLFKEGQYVEFTYEKFDQKITTCKEGVDIKILTIKEITQITECKAYFTATNKLWSNPAMIKKVAFTNLSTGDIKECNWNFGDNTTSKELKPIHEYETFGEYKVCLTTLTTSGCRSEYCALIKVENTATVSSCPFDLVIKPKESNSKTYLFYAISSSEIKTWKWIFGDGKASNLKNPEHNYEKAGTYEVVCEITTSAGCTETRRTKYKVSDSPISSCKSSISLLLFEPTENNCNGKATVKLLDETGKEIQNVKYTWSDGRVGSTFDNLCPDKSYTVQAMLDGICQKNTSFTLLSKPVWKAATINGQNNFTVISPVEGIDYEWNFGNGAVLKGAEVNFDFGKDGVYDVNLKAIAGSDFAEFSQLVVVAKSITTTDIINKTELEIYPNPVKEMLRPRTDCKIYPC